ncbi:cholinephosphotransferase 1 isoform X3 [Canis lupus baileyi]|uniref:cholinephosphotransferase 1 isoform X3 n=1 Tax=Canis lupus dingo TaxID=286419 RepID=UPI0003AD7A4A|nr:cholinephosphotransferase 1 isoform X3 [Canis lupus dingo]
MAAGAGARPGLRWPRALAEPLSAAQLRRLEEHRYCAAGVSLLEPPLQVYWTWLLRWVPLWVAPNSITLLGLAVNLFTTLALISYCPTATEEAASSLLVPQHLGCCHNSAIAPYWTYLLCALGLFIYQSLDAIDGKQARRTNSCSPLGELFDHGCDSLSTVFMAVGASIAVRLGTHPDWLFFCSFIGMFMFYCAHWQTYVSGVLRFGKVDVTEIQIALVMVFVFSTFGGATMWDYTIPILEIKLKIFPVLGVVGGAIFSCSNYFHVILHGGVGKNGSTIAGTSVLSPGLHIGIIIILAIMIYKKSATNVFEKHPCLYTLMFGCVFAKVSQKLVIAHMTKSELYLQDTVFFGPGLLFLDQYFNNFIDEYVVLWIAMVISSFDMMMYFSALCLQISRHLHLNIFKTSYHEAPEQVQVLPSKSHQNNMD